VSKQVKTWLREHNQTVLQEAQTGKAGVRIIPCWLPTQSAPGSTVLGPKWVPSRASQSRACSVVDRECAEIRGLVTPSAVTRWSRLRKRSREYALAPDSYDALPEAASPTDLQGVTPGSGENGEEPPLRVGT
jgi:hypothetical protein